MYKGKKLGPRFYVTEETLQYIVDNWDSKTIKEIGEGLGCSEIKARDIAYKLRKLGIPLAKKSVSGCTREVYRTFVDNYLKSH